ncbi:hypothetical protein G6N05_00990 [Flavobacterium sp. F372]|uniref:Cytochrome C Planctomycete-type domain-containing protein n=1 Tax=Flavobacterium bernardetii TaxID=2813823 RepID=A0ABR7IUJ7_9FLAO|nr:c-type cytochrome domain-containing protein [Flavobacterium bernardetii]MBC5833450.1 hypothetical protein [Flavobacterium bernardetii]NHF68682.1 hypothetical protein [Flavobacterium bernardetii]
MKKAKYLIILSVFSGISCSNNSEDDLTTPINSGEITTYNNYVKSVIDNNCISCHGATSPYGGLTLTTYNQVKNAVLNNNLLDRINSNDASSVMPTSGKLPENTLLKISDWNTDGLLE